MNKPTPNSQMTLTEYRALRAALNAILNAHPSEMNNPSALTLTIGEALNKAPEVVKAAFWRAR